MMEHGIDDPERLDRAEARMMRSMEQVEELRANRMNRLHDELEARIEASRQARDYFFSDSE